MVKEIYVNIFRKSEIEKRTLLAYHSELTEMISEASAAFVEKQYHTACYKYKAVLKLIERLNINSNNNDQVILQYMLCKTLIELNTSQDILRALETLIQLEKYIGNSFPAIYYAMGKAYIKLYRFNSALDAINAGLAIANTRIYFNEFCIPTTSITIKESTKEGLLTALMNLHDEASSWHCPDAKCYMEDCQNQFPHCLPSRDIFFKDPAFSGLVVVTCSNINNPCKFKFHPVCWDFQKEKLNSMTKPSDKEVIDHPCFTLNCTSDTGMNVITKIEVFDNNQTIISTAQKSTIVTKSISNSSVQGAIKKYAPQPLPKLRRPNLPHRFSLQKICSEEQSLEDIEKEIRLVKLVKLRETNFGVLHGKDDENLDSATEILSDVAFKDDDVETIQQCRFILEILHEFIKSNLMVHTNKVLSKWHETKQIMECAKDIDEYLDSDIVELLLKSTKFINIGNYFCIPETLEQALQMFEREIIQQCKFVLPCITHTENGNVQSTVNNTMSQKTIVTNSESKTDQISQRLCSKNDVNRSINNNNCEAAINFTKTNSLDEEKTNTSSQIKNMYDWNIEGGLHTSFTENEDKMDFNISHKDKSFIDSSGVKMNNQYFMESMVHEDNSQNSIKHPFLKKNATTVLDDNIIKQLSNNDHSSKFIILQEKYAQLMTNYSEMEQTLIKLKKEKTKMEQNFKLELEKKNSIMEAIIEERKILIKRLETYESHIAEDVPVKYEALNKDIVTLKAEISRLKQEKLDNEHNMKVLLQEKHVAENTLERNNTELFETIKHCQAEVDKKNTELMTFQEKNVELKKCMLEKSLESQFFHNQNILYQGIKHCQIAIEIFDNLNFTTKQHFGLNIIPNYTIWLQALTYLQAEYKQMQGNYLQLKSLLESKAEIEKMDKVTMNSINLPPCPGRSLGNVICDAFMLFYTHITQISRQVFAPPHPPILVAPHMVPYMHHSIQSNKSNFQKTSKTKIPDNSVNASTNVTQIISESEKKHIEDKHQAISQISDLDKKNNKGIQDNLQDTNNNKKVQCNLKSNENDMNDISNTFRENKLVCESNDVPDNIECKSLSENKIKEVLDVENIENTKQNNNEIYTNSTDKIMSMLRNKYTGMSDLSLLKSLNDLRKMHNGTLTGMPLNAIMQNVDKYVLAYQVDHLCTYSETKKGVKSSTTVLKGNKKQSKSKVKKKSSSNSVKLISKDLTKDLPAVKSLLGSKRNEHKSTKSSSGAIKKEPISLPKCPWDVIFKPGTNKNNYGESECVICMESLQEIDKLIYTLDCQHKFHKTCIKEWFQKSQSCPTCRIHCTIDEEYPPLP